MPYHEQPNLIVQVGLSALPGEWQLRITGEEYVGVYYLHEDGTAMAGQGMLGERHDIIPEKVIVKRQEEEQEEEQEEYEEQQEEQEEYDELVELVEQEFPVLTIASLNEFTEFITTKEYNWLVERVENVSTFLSTFSNMMNSFNGYIAGGYLRRVIQSGDAFQFQNADLDFLFQTSDAFLGAVTFVNQGNLTQFNQPDVQEISDDKVLYSWDLISNTSNIPNIKLQLIRKESDSIENILSNFDFTNAKIATNLNQVIIDSRWENFESNRIVNIDILKPPVLLRLLKYLHSEGEPFKLNGSSAFKFLTWVGPRVSYSPYMQQLYDVLLNANEVNYETISFIEPYLNELNLPTGELPPVNLPLNVSLI